MGDLSVVWMPFSWAGLAGIRDSFGPAGGTGPVALGSSGPVGLASSRSRRIAFSTL